MAKVTEILKSIARHTPAVAVYRRYQNERRYRDWIKAGRTGAPPPLAKQRTVIEYARRFELSVLIETGTYLGDMVQAVAGIFDRVYSVELSEELYRRAQRRFAKFSQVTILQGDSATVLPGILARVQQPCLFWLDGHYSEGITAKGEQETPIRGELAHIFAHAFALDHVILIDDARCFTGLGDYPSLTEVKQLAAAAGYRCCEMRDDIIRIHGAEKRRG